MEDHLGFGPVWEIGLSLNLGPNAVEEYRANRIGGYTNARVDYVSTTCHL